MQFGHIIQKARQIRDKYAELEKKRDGKEWTNEQLMQGFLGDVEELKTIVHSSTIDKEKLGHELSDCLWSIIILSDKYGINLEESFKKTMSDLENRLDHKTNQ